MLASVSGIVGNKGQINYVAAKNFLDAFAYSRQAHGSHSNAVDLGPIEGV